jgi:hypothetical protein
MNDFILLNPNLYWVIAIFLSGWIWIHSYPK